MITMWHRVLFRWTMLCVVCCSVGLVSGAPAPSTNASTPVLQRLLDVTHGSATYTPHDVQHAFPLVYEQDERDRVVHVGVRLFTESQRAELPSMMVHFAERFMLQLLACPSNNDRQLLCWESQFVFAHGNLLDVMSIGSQTDVAYRRNERRAQIEWSNEGEKVLTIDFVLNYQRLTGCTRAENEVVLWQTLAETRPVPVSTALPNHAPSLSTSDTTQQVASTLCDMLLGIVPWSAVLADTIRQVPLATWLNYCRENELQLYVSLEKELESAYQMLMIASSPDWNFNHMLSILVPRDFVRIPNRSHLQDSPPRNALLPTDFTLFVPTHNLAPEPQYGARK